MGKDDEGGRWGGRPPKGLPADSRLPNQAPDAMRLVWRLGCLTARQNALLWPTPISERRVRQVFADLRACGLLQRDRRTIRYAPSNAHLLLDGAAEGGRPNWEDLYTLTPRASGTWRTTRRFPMPSLRASTTARTRTAVGSMPT